MEDKKITVCPFCGRTAVSGMLDLNSLFKKLWLYCVSVNVLSIASAIVSYALTGVQKASIMVAANIVMLSASYLWFRWLLKRSA